MYFRYLCWSLSTLDRAATGRPRRRHPIFAGEPLLRWAGALQVHPPYTKCCTLSISIVPLGGKYLSTQRDFVRDRDADWPDAEAAEGMRMSVESFSSVQLPARRRLTYWNEFALGTYTPVIAQP